MSPLFSSRLLAAQSDARLVQLAADGHERAFEALVQRHRRPLLAYARKLLGSGPRAEDAVQQALLAAWLAIERGDEVRDAGAWLHRIVHNMALNLVRGADREVVGVDSGHQTTEGPDATVEQRMSIREMLAGVAQLPPEQRYALLQTAVHGRSRDEVAVDLGLTTGAVRGLAYRARIALRAGLTAITPPPLLAWAAGGGVPGGAGAVAYLGARALPAGIAATLAKGGAAALTAGAVVAGVATVDHRSPTHRRHAVAAPAAAVQASAVHKPAAEVPRATTVSRRAAAASKRTRASTTRDGGRVAEGESTGDGRHGGSAQTQRTSSGDGVATAAGPLAAPAVRGRP